MKIKYKLTGRERQVLELLLQGFTNAEIAAKLFISVSTVKMHCKNIYKKLEANGLRELIAKYVKSY